MNYWLQLAVAMASGYYGLTLKSLNAHVHEGYAYDIESIDWSTCPPSIRCCVVCLTGRAYRDEAIECIRP